MADLDEALGRADAMLDSARTRLGESHEALLRQLAELHAAQPAWKRWLCRSWNARAGDLSQAAAEDRKRTVDSLAEGFAMVRKRIERAMAKEGLYRIASFGLPVDPHAMTVVEVVDGEGHAPGTVIEEVRPGYRWKDKVIRYAEVRAARHVNQNSFATE
jgi:molecular chaperone GrpE